MRPKFVPTTICSGAVSKKKIDCSSGNAPSAKAFVETSAIASAANFPIPIETIWYTARPEGGQQMKLRALGIAAAALVACSDNNGGTDGGTEAGTMDSPAMDGTVTDTGVEPGSADFQIIDISDWHAQLDPISETDSMGESQSYGGLGVLMAYMAKERSANPNTLVFTGG